MPYLQGVVKDNLQEKPEVRAKVAQLDWEKDLENYTETFDVILGADVIYIEDVFPALLQTLLKLSHEKSKVYLSCRIRYDRDRTFLKMLKKNFTVTKIFIDVDKDIKIYKAIKRTF